MSLRIIAKRAVVSAAILISTAAFGQQQMQDRSPEQRAQRQMKWMQANLALTSDQNDKAYNILLKYASEADNAKTGGQRGARKEIQADKDAELKGILTGNQYQLYAAHMEQMKEKMQQRRDGGQQGSY